MTKSQQRKKYPVRSGIRIPLPKKTGGVHVPKTVYRRKTEKDRLRQELKDHF